MTDRLCREIAAESDGCCLLQFSGGKDSIASWLYLRSFFDRVIPFYGVSVPGLSFVEEHLQWYENFMDTEIIRLLEPPTAECLWRLVYQPVSRDPVMDEIDLWDTTFYELAEAIRDEYDLPDAWCADGLVASDSLGRRMKVQKDRGRNEESLTFYPIFDWTRDQIVGIMESNGCPLDYSYLIGDRSFVGVPHLWYHDLKQLREEKPEDFDKIKAMYPLIEVQIARNEFRKHHFGLPSDVDRT